MDCKNQQYSTSNESAGSIIIIARDRDHSPSEPNGSPWNSYDSYHAGHGQDLGGEWRVRMLLHMPSGSVMMERTREFCNRNFRNPHTGESIIPANVFGELHRAVWQSLLLFLLCFCTILLVALLLVLVLPFVIMDFDLPSSLKIPCVAGSVVAGILIGKRGTQWTDKSLHARMERVVQDRQGTLLECGVKLGYFRDTTLSCWSHSYVYLRRLAEWQASSVTTTTSRRSPWESKREEEQEEQVFPPIFFRWMIPAGDIHMNLKNYDRSMVMDREVGTMIQKAPFGSRKPNMLWKVMMPWMDKSLHTRMVDEFQGTFLECGVKLGYFHESTRCGWNRSHMWLRQIPKSQRERVATTTSSLLESSIDTTQDEQGFPPIFIHWVVPGEIHMNEKEYDPSMVIDQEVWTMIRNAHFGTYKPCVRYLAIFMVALAIIWLLYALFISFFMDLLGDFEAWLVYVGFLLSFALTWFILDRLIVRAWSQVADDVTSMLLHSENPNLHGTALKFETSPLPFRARHLSRRYQLVRVPGSTKARYTSGEKVDHVDCDDEHQLV